MAGKSADTSMEWFHPPRMRKRGLAATCEPKRKRPLLEDPFEKCSQCSTELGGFLTHNPSARRPTVLLSCGHVVCPDCHYKMKKPCETGGKNEGIHRESQFSCKTCGSWVFPLYLPSLTDLDLPRCSTPNCKSVSQVFFCNHCRNNLCCECRIKHDIVMPNHHVIEMPQGKKNQQTSFSRKHIGCVRHSQRTTSKCTGCGDIVCNKCHFAYSDMIDGKFIRHDRADITVADLDLENVMHNPIEYESRLYSMERIARRRRIDFQNQVDVLKNEVCVHFFNIINAALGRCYQVLQQVQAEEIQVVEKLKEVETRCTNAARRISVSCELDERARNLDLLDDQVAGDIYKSVAYTIFRPFYEEYQKAKNMMNHARATGVQLELREVNTTPIVDLISSWGGGVVSSCHDLNLGLCRQFAIPKYNLSSSWDGKTPVPPIAYGNSAKHRTLDLYLQPRHPNALFHLGAFRHIWFSLVEGEAPAVQFQQIQLRKNPEFSGSGKPVPVVNKTSGTLLSALADQRRTTVAVNVSAPCSSSASSIPTVKEGSSAATISRISVDDKSVHDVKPDGYEVWEFKTNLILDRWESLHGFKPQRPDFPEELVSPDLNQFQQQSWAPNDEQSIQRIYAQLRHHQKFSNANHKYLYNLSHLMFLNKISPPSEEHPINSSEDFQVNTSTTRESSATLVAGEFATTNRESEKTSTSCSASVKSITVVTPSSKLPNMYTSEKKEEERARIVVKIPRSQERLPSNNIMYKAPQDLSVATRSVGTHSLHNNNSSVFNKPVDMSSTSRQDQPSPSSESSERELDEDGSHKYCWVCNDTRSDMEGDKGICSQCPRVYHTKCHLPPIEGSWSDMPDDWMCTMCEQVRRPTFDSFSKLDNTSRKLCYKILLSCYENARCASAFAQPVPENTLGYRDVISQPMDLGTISARLDPTHAEPVEDTSDFIFLMNLVFQNCAKFNPKDSQVAEAGRKVWRSYQSATKRYLPQHMRDVWLYISLNTTGKKMATPQKRKAVEHPANVIYKKRSTQSL